MLVRLLLAIAGGLALTAAYEPLTLAPLVLVGPACFALATHGLSVPRAGLVGLAFGVAFYFTHIYWMRTAPGQDAWLALSTAEALFYGAVGLCVPLLTRLPAWPVWLAATWAAMEGIRSTWPFSGMPWGRLSFAVADTPLAPALAYVGMTGLSFLLALLSFLLARAVLDRGGLVRIAPPVVLAALLLVPAVAPYELAEDGSAVVAAVQGDVPGPGDDILWDHRGVTRNHVEATTGLADDVAAGRAPQPDFVLWPENTTAVDPFSDADVNGGIREAVDAIGVPVVVGGLVDDGPDHVLNQGIVWDPVSGPGDRYTKKHPVAYGEYIPYRRYWDPGFGDLAQIRRDMKAGTREEPLRVAGDRGGRRHLLRRRLRRRPARPSRARRRPADRADQQRDVHLHRPGRPAVRHDPAAGDRVRALAGRGGHQRRLRRRRPPTAPSWPPRSLAPPRCWSSGWA
ncbi:apolipoprotein N-acyltransferase [Nocardioides sp. TF02-7]|uniref:apolipoprotein N-acyltransferase n=1 Tax=Nocardioides sp. TF02-7 TaxID=2917724 RepID=UPI001F05929D|nr:apolipoprotein N-acyltransferase [Nocardioides sp. TF02-7]UMG92525.1 apolipoprotein N-acyltransferase [Nocardioides sp. TF02-7]